MDYSNFKNDEEALLRLASGDLVAYRYLFDSHFTDLCNFLLIYLHSREFSEEIALELFEYVWEKRESLQIRATFRAFLFSSARNRAITHYRKEHRALFSPLEFSEPIIDDSMTAEYFLEADELRKIIQKAISNLPEKSREIYLMAREENLSHKDIASRLGITPKTVENHVGIALRKLRESLMPFYKQIFMGWLIPLLLR